MAPKNIMFKSLIAMIAIWSSLFIIACGSGESETDGDNDKVYCELNTDCPSGTYCGDEGFCTSGVDGDIDGDDVTDGDTEATNGIVFRMSPADGVIDFGEISLGSEPTATITIYNDGNKVLHLQDANFLEPLTDNPWSLVGYAQAAIQPNTSFDFEIKMDAASLGEYSGRLQIRNDSDNNKEPEVTLSGTVTAPAGDAKIESEFDEIVFEDHELGTRPVFETVLIGNTGASNSTVYITRVYMESQTSDPFELTPADEISDINQIEISGHSSYGIPIWFKPQAAGDFSDKIVVEYYLSNDSNSAIMKVPVSGTSVIGSILLDPLKIDFGTVTKNQENTIDLKIINYNPNETITINSVRIFDVDNWQEVYSFTDQPAMVELEPSKSHDFSITFSPKSEGDFSGELMISTDYNGMNYYYSITATGAGENQKPVARIAQRDHGPDIVGTITGLSPNTGMTFYGDISYDPDGDSALLTYKWHLQSPTNSLAQITPDDTASSVAVLLDKAGNYTLTLVVTDELGAVSTPKIVQMEVEAESTSIRIEATYTGISGDSDVDLSWIMPQGNMCNETTAAGQYCRTAEGEGQIIINACGAASICKTETITHANAPDGKYQIRVTFDEDCPDSLGVGCPGGLFSENADVNIQIYVDGAPFQTLSTSLGDAGDNKTWEIRQISGEWQPPTSVD